MRLIDADAFRKVLEEKIDGIYSTNVFLVLDHVIDDLDEAPTIEAEPVVLCKDCIHSNAAGCSEGFTWCDKYDHGVTDDFYCKTGERRPDNG